MGTAFGWLEVRLIGEMLAEAHPRIDPRGVSFPKLRELVRALSGFAEEPGHPSNERILEEIQRHWLEEYLDLKSEDDEE